MTCKSIYVFLEENEIDPTKENKKRWQAGWTLSELKQGYENFFDEYEQNIENEFGEGFIQEKAREKAKKNEEKIMQAIETEKKRRESIANNFEQCTELEV